MPVPVDFRTLPFSINRVSDSGKYIGRTVYWRLYAIENSFRVIIHSILTVQINANWWTYVINPQKNSEIQKAKNRYLSQPGSTLPGSHDIYYLYLSDLSKIISAQRNLFVPIIPDIDRWIIKLEQIHLPRNIVGHMNWPNAADRIKIDRTYKEVRILLRDLSNSGFYIIIP
ncbi:hypothetical protein ANRL4_04956 [Anaerolineae bacterium]|nr:hypothetical protein ANRL4_04956 [Anaerolineae bacterium]